MREQGGVGTISKRRKIANRVSCRWLSETRIVERYRTISVNNPAAIRAWSRAQRWVGAISPPSVVDYRERDSMNVLIRDAPLLTVFGWGPAWLVAGPQSRSIGEAWRAPDSQTSPAAPEGRAARSEGPAWRFHATLLILEKRSGWFASWFTRKSSRLRRTGALWQPTGILQRGSF